MRNLCLILFCLLTGTSLTQIFAQCDEGELGMTVNLMTDQFGNETSFEILDSDGEQIAFEDDFENNDTYIFDYCLDPGCYTFTVFDSFGDGIFAQGGYTITNQYFQELAVNGNFDFEESVEVCLEELDLVELDLALIEASIEQDYCNSSISPEIQFSNEGEEAITSAVFTYSINGALLGTINWEGEVTTFAIETISIPTIENSDPGENTFSVMMIFVNGQPLDDNLDNNSTEFTFNVIEDLDIVSLTIDTGNDDEVEGFEIIVSDVDGDQFFFNEDFFANESYEFDICLPPGCYTLEMIQNIGNNLANTPYSLVDSEGNVLIEGPDIFGAYFGENFCTPNADFPSFDIEMIEILQPSDVAVCGETFSSSFDINNNGLAIIESLSIEYQINDGDVQTFEWTGNIGQFDSETIQLPSIESPEPGTHTINIEVVAINGEADEDPSNNLLDATFEISDTENIDGLSFTIETGDDNEVTGFEIIVSDFEGNEFFFNEDFVANASYSFQLCLPPGCYTLEMIQNIGNNLANTPYSLVDSEGNVLIEGSDIFGAYFSENFCTPNADILDYDVAFSGVTSPTTEPLCGQFFTPVFEFSNLGGEVVNSLEIEYQVDDAELFTYEWSGSVNQFQTETVELPTITMPSEGLHDLNINLIAINGQMDEDGANNTGTSSFEVLLAQAVILNITPDGGGFGTDYELVDENGNTVSQENNLSGGTNSIDLCILPGCYELIIEEAFSDGTEYLVESDIGIILAEGETDGNGSTTIEFCSLPLDLEDLDAGVSGILEPQGALCSSLVSPVIQFINNGFDPINEIVYEYIFDENIVSTGTWTGNLTTYQLATIALEELSGFSIGVHDLTVNILEINGQADPETDNNSLTQNFSIVDAEGYSLNITGDIAPQQNAYEIRDQLGNVLFSAPFGTFINPFALNVEELCLNPGCYVLVLFDQVGDGGPNYSITNGNQEIIVEGTYNVSDGLELEVPFCTAEDAGNLPVASIASNLSAGCAPLTVDFTNASANADNQSWSFPGADIESSTEANLSVVYSEPGTYQVSLTVGNATGESSTQQNIVVYDDPVIEFSVDNDNVTAMTPDGGGFDSYQWSDGSTESSTTFVDDVSVTVTDSNGCSTTEEYAFTGLNELPANVEVLIYPNPSNGTFVLNHNLGNDYEITVQDLWGRTIKNIPVQSGSMEIQLDTDLPNGLYLLQVANEQHRGVYKLLLAK